MFIVNSIAPLFLLIAFGKILQKTALFPDAFFKGLNRLVFWFALPALLISRISSAQLELRTIYQMLLLLTLCTLLVGVCAWCTARFMKLSSGQTGSFIQGTFRSNGAFIGLPVIIYCLGHIDPRAEVLGTVVLAPLVVLFNVISVIVLLHYGKEKHSAGESISTFLLQLVKNPLILACTIGFALNLSSIALPAFLIRPLDALGDAALPLILMSIGASLTFEPLQGAASPSLVASLYKVILAPLFGFLLAGLFELETAEKMIVIFYLGAPAAGMSYVMAEVMGNDATLAGRIVALSTLMSGITLPVIIAIGL